MASLVEPLRASELAVDPTQSLTSDAGGRTSSPTASRARRLHGLGAAALVGLASGAAVLAASGVILLRYLAAAADGFPEGASDMAIRYLTPHVGLIAAVYLALGLAAGAIAWWSRRDVPRGPWTRDVSAVAGCWAVLAACSMLFSPTSLAAVPVVRDLPAGVSVGACVLAALCCAALARVRWRRYGGGLAFAAAPLFLPDPSVAVAPVPAESAPHVFLLGLDNLGRAGMEQLAERVAASRPHDHGVRYLAEAVSGAPLTRFTWQGLVLHRDPGTVVSMDTLTTKAQRDFLAAQPFVLPRVAANAGYRTTFVTDEAATNVFLPGIAFDAVAQDAIGWQVGVRRLLSVTFPLAEGYVGRWMGVGITNAPGAAGTWRVWRAVRDAVAADPTRPQLVAAHGVALHAVIRPSAAEVGGIVEVLRRRPSDLRADDPLSLRPGGTHASATSIPQEELYATRQRDVVAQTAGFIDALEAAGYRRRSLIVVFTDHGELFLDDSTRNLPGLHGLLLEPLSTNVGALVLLPTDDPSLRPALGGPRTLHGTVPVEELAALVTEFVAAQTGASSAVRHADAMRASAPPGGWLHAIARGEALPRRVVAARSGGRTTLGDDGVYGGRTAFAPEEMRPEVQLWGDGRITLSSAGVALLDRTSDSGWSDGRWLVAFAPLEEGGFRAQCFRDATLVREWRTDAPGERPARAPARDADPASVCR